MNAREPDRRKSRVSFTKNRGKRRRQTDLTRASADNPDQLADLASSERLTGKGELSRRRTVVVEATDAGGELRALADSGCVTGRVLQAIGANHCLVQLADGALANCSVRRVLRTLARDSRNVVVAGDVVQVLPAADGTGVIERVEPRRGTLSRVSRHAEHVLVANVDQAVIVVSTNDPPLKPGLVDRLLCSAEKGEIHALICINKIDMGSPEQLQPLVGQYSRLGYPVVLTDALSGEGIEELRELLIGRETVFTGQSGVGKSSLLNAVQPGLQQSTREVSSDSGKGRHTTRVARLLPLDAGGWVVDTPGIRQLQLWDVPAGEVEGLFVEFRPFVQFCRFSNCTHLHEQECGVREARHAGYISPLRYENYVRIMTGDE